MTGTREADPVARLILDELSGSAGRSSTQLAVAIHQPEWVVQPVVLDLHRRGLIERGPQGWRRTALAHEPMGYDDLVELTDDERMALPAVEHRPVFDGLGVPHSWICRVCWGDGWQTSWPCAAATKGGVELAKALGLGWSW